MELKFSSRSENEAFARVTVASFISQLDPTVEELTDIKTVVSEAVTNAVIHGYEEKEDGIIYIRTEIEGQESASPFPIRASALKISTKPDNRFTRPKPELERSGMGFTIMENFMDEVMIHSKPGKGQPFIW